MWFSYSIEDVKNLILFSTLICSCYYQFAVSWDEVNSRHFPNAIAFSDFLDIFSFYRDCLFPDILYDNVVLNISGLVLTF